MLVQNGSDSKLFALDRETRFLNRDLPGWIDYKIDGISPVEYTTSFFRSMGVDSNVIGNMVDSASIVNLHWLPGHIRRSVWEILKGKKLIWTMHDMQPFTAFCHHSNSCVRYQGNCTQCPQAMGWEKPLIAREFTYRQEIINQSDIEIICPSEWLAERVSNSKIFHGKKVHIIPNPIDVQNIKPSENVGRGDTLRLGILGSNYGKYKGNSKTLDFMKTIPSDFIDKIELRILGDNYEELKKFRNTNIKLGSTDFEVIQYMEDIDIFLYLSEFENLPNLLVELQAKGIPVAAFPVGGVSETFVSGESGWEVRNPQDFIDILKTIFTNRSLLSKFSYNASLNAQQRFSFEKILPKYLSVYN